MTPLEVSSDGIGIFFRSSFAFLPLGKSATVTERRCLQGAARACDELGLAVANRRHDSQAPRRFDVQITVGESDGEFLRGGVQRQNPAGSQARHDLAAFV